jgi:hypothetical protein
VTGEHAQNSTRFPTPGSPHARCAVSARGHERPSGRIEVDAGNGVLVPDHDRGHRARGRLPDTCRAIRAGRPDEGAVVAESDALDVQEGAPEVSHELACVPIPEADSADAARVPARDDQSTVRTVGRVLDESVVSQSKEHTAAGKRDDVGAPIAELHDGLATVGRDDELHEPARAVQRDRDHALAVANTPAGKLFLGGDDQAPADKGH